MTTRTRARNPRLHRVTPGVGGAWSCCCGGYGNTGAVITGDDHLRVRAQSAFTRLDPDRAFTHWMVSAVDTSAREEMAVNLICGHRPWYGHPDLRRHLAPYYDRFGVLAARMRWDDLAAAVGEGCFPPSPGLLVLRAALSLLGYEPIMLGELVGLNHSDRVTLHRILGRWLDVPGEDGRRP